MKRWYTVIMTLQWRNTVIIAEINVFRTHDEGGATTEVGVPESGVVCCSCLSFCLRFAELAEACRTRFGNEGGGPESVFRLAYANAATLTSYSHTIRDAAHGRTHVGEKRSVARTSAEEILRTSSKKRGFTVTKRNHVKMRRGHVPIPGIHTGLQQLVALLPVLFLT